MDFRFALKILNQRHSTGKHCREIKNRILILASIAA